jgi:glycosyltransferase involved in cell wall biosynthesis
MVTGARDGVGTLRLGYLSGAPRVSTRPETILGGPRARLAGVVEGFERLGWEVPRFIAGDRVPLGWVADGRTDVDLRSNLLKRLGADVVRLGMNHCNRWRARRELGRVDWVYEMFGAFQSLGRSFQRQGVPWILETNALLFREATEDRSTVELARLLKATECRAYHQCDLLVCISQALADLVVEQAGVRRAKVIVVPNGVDTSRFDPARVESGRAFAAPTLGYVGILEQWQRLDLLIEVLADLHAQGVDFGLVVVGDGPMRRVWEELAAELGQSDRVRFVGQVPWAEVAGHIASFDLCYSGPVPLAAGSMYLSPLKLYEYAAMARPLVAADYEDAQRLWQAGDCGYLFRPGDKADLKRALLGALSERDRWEGLGRQARAAVVARHSWQARMGNLIRDAEALLEAKYGTPYPARGKG